MDPEEELARRKRRQNALKQWQDSVNRDKWPDKARAATKLAVSDIVRVLASETPKHGQRTTAEYAFEHLGELMSEEVRAEIDRILDEISLQEAERFRIAMADHFWCEFFAAIAKLSSDVKISLDSIPEKLTDVVVELRESDRRNVVRNKVSPRPIRIDPREPIERYLVRRVVQTALDAAWKPIKDVYSSPLISLTLHARIMAVLVCPAPERHWEVAEHCMAPLFNQYIHQPTIDHLKETLCFDAFGGDQAGGRQPGAAASGLPA